MIRQNRSFRLSLLATTLLCGASAASLLAQAPADPAAQTNDPAAGGKHHRHHGPPPMILFNTLDTNHDGVISADEMTAAPASLKTLLKDGAPELKREDLRPAHAHLARRGGPEADSTDASGDTARPQHRWAHRGMHRSPLFDALDTDHDGAISTAEMDNAPTALKTLLKDGATELKREDLRPVRPEQPQTN